MELKDYFTIGCMKSLACVLGVFLKSFITSFGSSFNFGISFIKKPWYYNNRDLGSYSQLIECNLYHPTFSPNFSSKSTLFFVLSKDTVVQSIHLNVLENTRFYENFCVFFSKVHMNFLLETWFEKVTSHWKNFSEKEKVSKLGLVKVQNNWIHLSVYGYVTHTVLWNQYDK